MAQLPSAFNPGAPGQEGIADFSAIPAGEYVAHIVSSRMVETKEKTGYFLELVWQVLTGDHVGRKLWSRLNLINNSTATVEIANKHLKSICDAIGIPGPVSNSDVLHARACIIRVSVTPATSQYPEGNEVKNYEPYGTPGAGAAVLPAAAALTPAVPVAAAVEAPAWGNTPPAAAPVAVPAAVPAVPAPSPAVPVPAVPVAVPAHPVPAADLGVPAPGVPIAAPATPDPAAIVAAEAAAAAPHIPEAAPVPAVVPDAAPGTGPSVPDEKPPWLR